MTEAEIKSQIIEYLELRGIFCWTVYNGGIYDPKRGVFRRRTGKGMRKGIPDVFAIYRGQFIAIETKSQKGKTTPEQESFLLQFAEHGGVSIVARSVNDVAMAIETT